MNEMREENGTAVADVVIVDENEVPQTETKSQKPRTRYSDDELKEFRQIILKKIERARLIITESSNVNEHDIADTDFNFKSAIEGGSHSNDECALTISRQKKFIEHLQLALIRIENKTFGIDQNTGKLISKERLIAVPHAMTEMEEKLKQNEKQKKNFVFLHQLYRPSFH